MSIVLPVFNAEAFLDECMHGIAAQCHRPLEVVVYDNGSTDGSPELLRQWRPRLEDLGMRVVTVPTHAGDGRGCGYARNRCIEAASGAQRCTDAATSIDPTSINMRTSTPEPISLLRAACRDKPARCSCAVTIAAAGCRCSSHNRLPQQLRRCPKVIHASARQHGAVHVDRAVTTRCLCAGLLNRLADQPVAAHACAKRHGAAGDWICSADADDIMLPGRVRLQLAAALAAPPRTLLGCRFVREPADATWHYALWANTTPQRGLWLQQFRECTVVQPTWFYPRSLWASLGARLGCAVLRAAVHPHACWGRMRAIGPTAVPGATGPLA